MQRVTSEFEALRAREADVSAALEMQRGNHKELAASLQVVDDKAACHVR